MKSNLSVLISLIHQAHLSLSIRGFGIAKNFSLEQNWCDLYTQKLDISAFCIENVQRISAHAQCNCMAYVTRPMTIFGFWWEIQLFGVKKPTLDRYLKITEITLINEISLIC